MIHEEALYQVYAPLPLPLTDVFFRWTWIIWHHSGFIEAKANPLTTNIYYIHEHVTYASFFKNNFLNSCGILNFL